MEYLPILPTQGCAYLDELTWAKTWHYDEQMSNKVGIKLQPATAPWSWLNMNRRSVHAYVAQGLKAPPEI